MNLFDDRLPSFVYFQCRSTAFTVVWKSCPLFIWVEITSWISRWLFIMCIAHRAPITASRLQTFESITDRLQYVYMYMNCALIHYPPPLPVPVLWVSNFKTNMHKIIGGFPFVFSWRKQGRPINPRTPEDSGVDSGESFTPAEHNFLAPEHSNYEFQKLGIRTFWSQIQKF